MEAAKTRRENLLKAGAHLFARWGFDKTSVDDIAREAGISKGGVYLEFPNKEALFRAVLYSESLSYTEDWLQRFENDPGEWSFARMLQHSIAAIQVNPLMKALHMRDKQLFGSFLRSEPDLLLIKTSMSTELFQRLQEEGAMRTDIPAGVLAYLMSVIGYGLVAGDEIIPKEDKVPIEDSLMALGLLLDRGLAPEKARKKDAGRAYLVAMVKKMRDALSEVKI